MFEASLRESKPLPDFSASDDFQVSLKLRGEVQDPRFLEFLEEIGKETLGSFTLDDLMILDLVFHEQPVPAVLKLRLPQLRDRGIIEMQGRGQGVRYFLSSRFYDFVGSKGTYTRKRGLDRETNKELLFRHIRDSRREGCQLKELMDVLPTKSGSEVQALLRELQKEGGVYHSGRTRAARWFPGNHSHSSET